MGSKFKKAVSIAMVGTILMSSPAIASFAEVAAQKVQKFTQNRAVIEDGPCIYLTAPPKLQVGDSIDINFAGVTVGAGLYSGGTVTWYRGTGQTGDAIPDATGFSYTLTDEDVGYYIYATVERDIDGETLLMKSEHLGQTAAFVEEVENWVVDGDWEYDELNEGGVQIRFRRLDENGKTYYGGTQSEPKKITIPSTIGGHTVVKIADNAFSHCAMSTSIYSFYPTVSISSKLPKTLREIGNSICRRGMFDSIIIAIPESVVYLQNSFPRYSQYVSNGSPVENMAILNTIKVLNPKCYISGLPMSVNNRTANAGLLNYTGAKGSSLENVYWKEVSSWISDGLSTPHKRSQSWEQQGVYNPNSGLTLTKGELTQQDLDNNIKEWETSTDGKFDKDVIDGREDLVIKPNDIKGNDVIEIPDSLDGKEVGAVEVDTSGKPNVVIKVPDNVYIDRDSTIDRSTIISGATGSDAEDFAKDKDLVFEAIDKELTTKEEFDNAKKSNWITSKDGYWSYRFINGFAGVEVQNIKSFGTDAIVEVPELIDGHKTVVFKGGTPNVTYKSVELHEKIVILSEGIGYWTYGGFAAFHASAKNVTVYNKNMDLTVYSVTNNDNSYPTSFTGWLGSTVEEICDKHHPSNTSRFNFIPLDSKTPIAGVTIIGDAQQGSVVYANVQPEGATVTYQWESYPSNTTLSNNTSDSCMIPSDLVGEVWVTVTGTGDYEGTVQSTPITVEASTPTPTPSIEITGTNEVGATLTATPTKLDGMTQFDVTWYSGAEVVKTETQYGVFNSTYTVQETDKGKEIYCVYANDMMMLRYISNTINIANSTGTTTGRIPNSTEDVDYVQEDLTDKGFDETLDKDVEVYASQGQSFTVRVPKRIVMNGGKDMNNTSNFTTTVKADIAGDDIIIVEPSVLSFNMESKEGSKRPILASVTAGKTSFSITEDTQAALEAGVVANHSISVDRLSSGSWQGLFGWVIRTEKR